MPDDLKDTAAKELVDLVRILMILLKEGVAAVAVVAIGRGIAWSAEILSPGADWVVVTVRTICDLAALFLFLALVGKDLSAYLKNR